MNLSEWFTIFCILCQFCSDSLVFIMENEGPSHRPRLGCETYHPQGARPVLVAQWGWLLGWPLKKRQKGHLCHQVLLQKPPSLGLDSWFRPLDFFNLGRNPICVGCTQFKLSSSSTLIPFRGSNTPFWWHKTRAHLSAVRKNRTRIYLSPRFQEGQRLLPVLSHFLLLCFRVDTQLGSFVTRSDGDFVGPKTIFGMFRNQHEPTILWEYGINIYTIW
jgi:hypothetical protein